MRSSLSQNIPVQQECAQATINYEININMVADMTPHPVQLKALCAKMPLRVGDLCVAILCFTDLERSITSPGDDAGSEGGDEERG